MCERNKRNGTTALDNVSKNMKVIIFCKVLYVYIIKKI